MPLAAILLTLVSAIGLAIAVLTQRNPILLRMALRNLARGKGYAVIVVCGLTIGTAMIASALIYQDTQEYYLVKDVYNRLGLVDEIVSQSGKTGLYFPFPYAVYEELAEQVADDERIYAISPGLVNLYVRVKDECSGVYKSRATLFGMDFGPFTTPDGQEVYGEDLGPSEAIITQGLADALKAEVGDRLTIYPFFLSPLIGF
jgi:putative ABC transport system permease protein